MTTTMPGGLGRTATRVGKVTGVSGMRMLGWLVAGLLTGVVAGAAAGLLRRPAPARPPGPDGPPAERPGQPGRPQRPAARGDRA